MNAPKADVPAPRDMSESDKGLDHLLMLGLALLGAFGLLAVLYMTQETVEHKAIVVLRTLPWGGGLAILAAFGYSGWLRRRSARESMVVRSVLAIVVVVPVIVAGGFLFVNQNFDFGAAASHDVRVINNPTDVVGGGKSSRHMLYFLVLERWRKDVRDIRIEVSSEVYQGTKVGSLWRVRTKPGLLGHEWIVGAQALGKP